MRIANKQSFTMLELMTVITIIGTLVILSFPHYLRARERVWAKEAIANLHLMIAAERVNAMEMNGAFVFCQCIANGAGAANACSFPGPGVPGCNISLRVSLDERNYSYYTILPNPTTVIAVAERQGVAPPPVLDCEYRMQFVLGNPGASDAAPVPQNVNCPER